MGREIRMVPPDWQHPVDDRGNFIPLHEPERYEADAEHYRLTKAVWNDVPGARAEYALKYDDRTVDAMIRYRDDGGALETSRSEDGNCSGWINPAPVREDYMPDWLPEKRTHLMMYETCTEGTPLSPAFATPEELARWLADNGASAFGHMTASYEDWLATCRSGFAVSAVIKNGALHPGVGMKAKENHG